MPQHAHPHAHTHTRHPFVMGALYLEMIPLPPLQNPMILSPETEGEKAMQYVGGLLERLDELQKKAFSFKTYQKTFKVHSQQNILGQDSWAREFAPTLAQDLPRLWQPKSKILPRILYEILGKILASWVRSWPSCAITFCWDCYCMVKWREGGRGEQCIH